MANRAYGLGFQKILEGSIAWLSDNIKINLLNAAIYTPNTTTDEFLAVIPGGAIIATSANLASKTSTLGTADAADVTFSSVTGAQASYIAVYKDTGSSATSPLLALYDTGTNLPVTPNGGNIGVTWDNGANKMWTIRQKLAEGDRRGILDWIRGLAGAESPGGIWFPSPTITQR